MKRHCNFKFKMFFHKSPIYNFYPTGRSNVNKKIFKHCFKINNKNCFNIVKINNFTLFILKFFKLLQSTYQLELFLEHKFLQFIFAIYLFKGKE